jgi:hypothetical protein
MGGRTEEMTLSFSSEVNGATVLEVSDSGLFECHLSLSVHREIGLAVNVISFDGMRELLFASGITRDDRLSLEIFDDETEDIFCVIEGITTHGFDHEREGFLCFLEHRDCLMDFADIGWMGDFPKRKFFLSISHDVISVAPEVSDFFLERRGKVDQDSQSNIGVSFGYLSFIEAVGDRGFKVILPYLSQNGTGVHDEVFPGDDLFFQKCSHQLGADVLQSEVRGFPEKLRKSFDGGRGFIGIESHRFADWRIILEFKSQIGEGFQSA